MTRVAQVMAGIDALRDATRVLRGQSSARKGHETDTSRSALFDLGGLADRLTAFAEDQHDDDWYDFWVTADDVDVLRGHVATLSTDRGGMAATTVPALQQLVVLLAPLAQHEA